MGGAIRPYLQFIKYVRPHPARQQLFGTDSGPEPDSIPENCSEGNEGSVQSLMWGRIFSNNRRLNELTKDYKNSEITTQRTMGDITTTMKTQFAHVDTQFAHVRAEFMGKFAEAKVDSNHVTSKLSFIQWQLGILGGAVVTFLSFAGYGIKKLMDVYIPQVAPEIPAPPATKGKNVPGAAEGQGATEGQGAAKGQGAVEGHGAAEGQGQ
ncbi:hypothetical protein C7212DRAFT_362538 [Tuber magnatum]|uniref:Uncharacterized protein n=1 Tax=Tuber magnatum TaxID=42249 RepID=A0A317SX00_9PEZI|nr:hypothetical protein C7212DRAFT_362538 [Tuber magnatum]